MIVRVDLISGEPPVANEGNPEFARSVLRLEQLRAGRMVRAEGDGHRRDDHVLLIPLAGACEASRLGTLQRLGIIPAARELAELLEVAAGHEPHRGNAEVVPVCHQELEQLPAAQRPLLQRVGEERSRVERPRRQDGRSPEVDSPAR